MSSFNTRSSGNGVRLRPDTLRAEFAKRLWTARKASEMTGVPTSTMSSVLRGDRIAPATAEKILRALEENPTSPAADALLA